VTGQEREFDVFPVAFSRQAKPNPLNLWLFTQHQIAILAILMLATGKAAGFWERRDRAILPLADAKAIKKARSHECF
jgi:hypothetical protein